MTALTAQASLARAAKRPRAVADVDKDEHILQLERKNSAQAAKLESNYQVIQKLQQQLAQANQERDEKDQVIQELKEKAEEEKKAKETHAKKESEMKKEVEDKKLVVAMRAGAMTESGDNLFSTLTTKAQVDAYEVAQREYNIMSEAKDAAEFRADIQVQNNETLKRSGEGMQKELFLEKHFKANTNGFMAYKHEVAAMKILQSPAFINDPTYSKFLNDPVARAKPGNLRKIFFRSQDTSYKYMKYWHAA